MPLLAQILTVFVALAPPTAPVARPPLLQDGSFLSRVQGTLEPASGGRGWAFRLHSVVEGQPDRRLELLPSAVLEDMVRRHDALPQGSLANFEISARVTTYRGENAALPLAARPVATLSAPGAREAIRPPGAYVEQAPAPAAKETVWEQPSTAEDPMEAFGIRWVPLLPQAREARERAMAAGTAIRADDVEQALLDRMGEVPRSLDVAATSEADRPTPAPRSLDPISGRPWLEPARPVQDRHGVVARDPVTGEWRFVFESSRGEVGEREATLLPCALLERIEREARSTQGPLSLVVSGQVTRYAGRAYLLPTVVEPMRSGRLLGR